MRHLNYTHLLYFWTVATEGTIASASKTLHLTPQTISGQLKLLEESVGTALFTRVGRGLALTDTGKVVKQYADDIFALGSELTQRVKSQQALTPKVLNVGIVDSIPKLIAMRILAPVLSLDEPVRLSCHETGLEHLLADLAVHRLDLVISERRMPPDSHVKAYSHVLGETGISFFAHNSIAGGYTENYPQCLQNAPVLLPVRGSALRRSLDDWFWQQNIVPNVVAEFDDSALLKAFGEAGLGIFSAPSAIQEEVCEVYNATLLGAAEGIREHYYAISTERRIKHPAILAITESARNTLL